MPDATPSGPLEHEQVMEIMIRHAAGQIGDERLAAIAGDLLCGMTGAGASQLMAEARRALTARILERAGDEMTTDGNLHHRATLARFGGSLAPVEPEAYQSLPRSTAGHRADLGAAVAAIPRPQARSTVLARVAAAAHRLDDSVLGDFLAALSLFGTGYILFFCAGVLS